MPWRSALDNIRLPLELQRRLPEEQDGRAREMVPGRPGGFASCRAIFPERMAQRVALTRLVHEPDVLLLDEPFGASTLTRSEWRLSCCASGRLPVTVVMVTH
jgi:NitT/TauT family transport system ATP-binding protein